MTALGYAVDALLALGLLVTAAVLGVAAVRDACRLLRRGTARRRPATAVPDARVIDAVLRFGGLDDTSAVPVVTRVTEPLRGGARPMTALARPVHQAHLDRVASGPPTVPIDPDPALGCPCCPGARSGDCTCSAPCGDPQCQAIDPGDWSGESMADFIPDDWSGESMA